MFKTTKVLIMDNDRGQGHESSVAGQRRLPSPSTLLWRCQRCHQAGWQSWSWWWCWIWTNRPWQLSCSWRNHDMMTLQGGGRWNHHFLGAGHLRLLRGLCAQSHLRQASTIRSVQMAIAEQLLEPFHPINTNTQSISLTVSWTSSSNRTTSQSFSQY